MLYTADVGKALDLVTQNLGWGDAEVLAALNQTRRASAPSPDDSNPLVPIRADAERTGVIARVESIKADWLHVIPPSDADAHTRIDMMDAQSTCTATRQCLLDALAVDRCTELGLEPACFECCVSTALTPLLSYVREQASKIPLRAPAASTDPSASVSNSGPVELLRACYASLLTAIVPPLTIATSTSTEHELGTATASWCGCEASRAALSERESVLRRLLDPFIATSVEPLEKALSFHFAFGKTTAPLDAPQYFFTFLASQLKTLPAQIVQTWYASDEVGHVDVGVLVSIAQGCLLRAAAAVFADCYQWRMDSPFLQHTDYCVTVINAVIDFTGSADEVMDAVVTAECFVAPLLLSPALDAHFLTATRCAARALDQGGSVLWRRRFLRVNDAAVTDPPVDLTERDENLRRGTLHFVRSTDAYVLRLGRDLLPFTTSRTNLAVRVWDSVVSPAVLIFARAARAHIAEEPDARAQSRESLGSLARVEQLCVLLSCCDAVLSAVDQWTSVLQSSNDTVTETTAPTLFNADSVSALVLFRDGALRECVSLMQSLAQSLLDASDAGESGVQRLAVFRRMERMLAVAEMVLDEHTLNLIVDAVKETWRRCASPSSLSAGGFGELSRHLQQSGWPRIAAILAQVR